MVEYDPFVTMAVDRIRDDVKFALSFGPSTVAEVADFISQDESITAAALRRMSDEGAVKLDPDTRTATLT